MSFIGCGVTFFAGVFAVAVHEPNEYERAAVDAMTQAHDGVAGIADVQIRNFDEELTVGVPP